MKYFLLATMLWSLYSCDGGRKTGSSGTADERPEAVKDSVPACVRKLIDDGKKDLPPTPPLQVDEYVYNGKKVFLFTADCCDQFNVVYDEDCKRLCAASGGITGRGDGNCVDFEKKATYVKVVWKKEK